MLDERGQLFRFLYILSLFSTYSGTPYLYENTILHDVRMMTYTYLLYDVIRSIR